MQFISSAGPWGTMSAFDPKGEQSVEMERCSHMYAEGGREREGERGEPGSCREAESLLIFWAMG